MKKKPKDSDIELLALFVKNLAMAGKRSGKLTQQWNIPIFNRKYIFKGSISPLLC